MNIKPCLALFFALALTHCATSNYEAGGRAPKRLHYYDDVGGPEEDARVRRDLGPSFSDYHEENIVNAYRAGFSAGRRDRLDGKARDPHRAFAGWGGDYESFFRDGYFDGYLKNGMRH